MAENLEKSSSVNNLIKKFEKRFSKKSSLNNPPGSFERLEDINYSGESLGEPKKAVSTVKYSFQSSTQQVLYTYQTENNKINSSPKHSSRSSVDSYPKDFYIEKENIKTSDLNSPLYFKENSTNRYSCPPEDIKNYKIQYYSTPPIDKSIDKESIEASSCINPINIQDKEIFCVMDSTGSNFGDKPQSDMITCSTPLNDPDQHIRPSKNSRLVRNSQPPVLLDLNNGVNNKYYYDNNSFTEYNDIERSYSLNRTDSENSSRLSSSNYSSSNASRRYSAKIRRFNDSRYNDRIPYDLQELNFILQNMSHDVAMLRQEYNSLISSQRHINRRADRNLANYKEIAPVSNFYHHSESLLSFNSQFVSDKIITSSPSNSIIE